jgi:hypothetical protein
MVDGLIGVYDKMLPPWLAGSVRAADGRLVMESVMPHVAALGPASNKADVIAGMAPADTVFLATGHDLGARLKTVRGMFDAEPAFKDVLAQVDKAMGIVGGFDAATGWIGDFGIVITRQGAAVDGGVIIAPTNAGDANRLLTSIRSLVEVGAGSSLTFGEESYAGTTIVTLDLSSLANLGAAMGGGESSGIPSDLKLAWAVSDNVVVMGVGPQFVKDVLDARSGESLAKQARYSSLVNAAGAQNSGVIWVDPTAIRGMVEPLLPADAKSSYEKDLKPYLEPFDAVVGVTVAGDSLDRVTVYLTVTP